MAPLVHNKKAGFNYEFLEKFEAGLDLLGSEVKSLRSHQGSLDGAYVSIRGGEAFLLGSYIPPYQPNNGSLEGYDPERARKLLLTKGELADLIEKEKADGLTIVPISVYNKGRYLKLEIALARGKKKFDKRETIKKRDVEREIGRTLKN
ncbi:MAG TPA: SsrA-binding protein SmpB [Candidatus Paceibacterota bacterium]|nr:SsrA-binding protein SmpB [Candidatus Paceibacterota bacterium]